MMVTTTADIRLNNYQNIYRLFFQHAMLSKSQIARLLNLSLPTVVNNLDKLEQEGKIRQKGWFKPQGGRPATAYQLVDDAFVAVSVKLEKADIQFCVLSLKGEILHKHVMSTQFENHPLYIETICQQIKQFIQKTGYDFAKILGIGFSVQGIVDKAGQSILYGKVLNFEQLSVAQFQPHFPFPVKLFHDVKCAANAELWHTDYIDNGIYISISEHLGGAVIVHNEIDFGKKGYSGALEHFSVGDQDRACYCGQTDCLETYCSLSALLEPHETLAEFFHELREGKQSIYQRWQTFLCSLAKGLNYAYLLLERNIILGGEIAPYLLEQDLIYLQQEIACRSSFPITEKIVSIAKVQENSSLIGAGLPFLMAYLKIKEI